MLKILPNLLGQAQNWPWADPRWAEMADQHLRCNMPVPEVIIKDGYTLNLVLGTQLTMVAFGKRWAEIGGMRWTGEGSSSETSCQSNEEDTQSLTIHGSMEVEVVLIVGGSQLGRFSQRIHWGSKWSFAKSRRQERKQTELALYWWSTWASRTWKGTCQLTDRFSREEQDQRGWRERPKSKPDRRASRPRGPF